MARSGFVDSLLGRFDPARGRLGQENAALDRIGATANSSPSLVEVWEQLAADLRSLIDFDRVSVAFVHPEQGTLTEGHVAGIDVPGRRQGDVRRLAGTVAEEAVTRRTSALVTGEKPSEVWLGRFPELKPSLEAGIRGVVAVPLLRGERVDAVLEFASLDPNAYSLRHLELAQRIGSRVLGAILNSRQYTELKPESTEGGRRVSVLKQQEGAPVLLG